MGDAIWADSVFLRQPSGGGARHVLPPTYHLLSTLLSQPVISTDHSAKSNAVPQESGRLQYFGFSSMDCGIVIRDIGTRDSGGWTCRVSATVAGKHQVSADIVRLFVGNNLSSSLSLSKATVSANYQKHSSSVYRGLAALQNDLAHSVSKLACKALLYWHRLLSATKRRCM